MTDPQKNKPALDEQTLQRLLEAAYVMQEHNREMQQLGESLEQQSQVLRQQELAQQALKPSPPRKESSRANTDYTLTLAEIVETQRQLQRSHLDLEKAMTLVAERAVKITNASGAGVATLEGTMVRYRAGSGTTALPAGTEVPIDKAICKASLQIGQTIRTEELNTEFFFDPDECRKRAIESLISVPVYHEGKIVGALELYFAEPKGFAEQDVHTCQLMAGLITEAFARDQEASWKKSLAAERATMLEVLEKLKPNLAALAAAETSSAASTAKDVSAKPTVAQASSIACWKCGHDVVSDEQFCGNCGAPRMAPSETRSLQSKVASAWHMQAASVARPGDEAASSRGQAALAGVKSRRPAESSASSEGELPPDFDLSALAEDGMFTPESAAEISHAASPGSEDPDDEAAHDQSAEPVTALAKTDGDVVWNSAAQARDYLEGLAGTQSPSALQRFWNARRGDFYLAVAVIFVALVIRWGIWSEHSVGATGRGAAVSAAHRKPAPDADLSAFDKLLINLGLADPPDAAPEYRGNPETQVWVDLHTALYYCPGTDLYGKTPKGKYTSQRDAQLDQFEPAYRRACD